MMRFTEYLLRATRLHAVVTFVEIFHVKILRGIVISMKAAARMSKAFLFCCRAFFLFLTPNLLGGRVALHARAKVYRRFDPRG